MSLPVCPAHPVCLGLAVQAGNPANLALAGGDGSFPCSGIEIWLLAVHRDWPWMSKMREKMIFADNSFPFCLDGGCLRASLC